MIVLVSLIVKLLQFRWLYLLQWQFLINLSWNEIKLNEMKWNLAEIFKKNQNKTKNKTKQKKTWSDFWEKSLGDRGQLQHFMPIVDHSNSAIHERYPK